MYWAYIRWIKQLKPIYKSQNTTSTIWTCLNDTLFDERTYISHLCYIGFQSQTYDKSHM